MRHALITSCFTLIQAAPRACSTQMLSSIRVRAYAKINWTLDVLFRREDGYHELRTIYQTISLYDRLHISLTGSDIRVTCADPRVPTDESNIVCKAALLLREAADVRAGATIDIEKRIPVAGGLGGGSSNAAAALLGLIRLWGASVPEREMFSIAARLGSDVPFFLVGGTALGVGRGEEVYALSETRCENLLLANPGVEVSTAEAYGKLSRLTRPEAVRIIPFTLLAANGVCELPLAASNDLEEVVLAAHPEIAELKRGLLSLGARHALMSGSGATVYAVFDNLETSERAQFEMRAAGVWSERVRTIDRREYRDTLIE